LQKSIKIPLKLSLVAQTKQFAVDVDDEVILDDNTRAKVIKTLSAEPNDYTCDFVLTLAKQNKIKKVNYVVKYEKV
jgi:hypothetical protein